MNNKTQTIRLRAWEALAVAFLLICLVFPDIIFHNGSLRVTDQLVGAENHLPIATIYPHPKSRQWWDSYNDYGGSMYQSEPMIEFMRYSIWHHDSPYWNPYSGAGQLGPEALVDLKFSFFTVINAILGGGSHAYNITLLALYFFGAYFIYRIGREKLRLSVAAGLGMTVFYLLNGYITANTASNISFNYLVVPFCLYFSMAFLEKPAISRLAGVIFSFAAFFSCTFLPTTIALLVGIYGILIGYLFLLKNRSPNFSYSQATGLLFIQVCGVLTSVLLLSFLYLPILENIKTSGILDMYLQRQFYAVNWPGLLSLFSPTHFFNSYGAMSPEAFKIVGNSVFHFGIVALVLIGCSIAKVRQESRILVFCCLGVTALILARIFGVPVVSHLIAMLPVIGNLGCQYWWAAIVFPMLILVGIGINNLQANTIYYWPLLLIVGVEFIVGFCIWHFFSLNMPPVHFKMLALLAILSLLVCASIIAKRFISDPKVHKLLVFGLVVVMLVELTMDSKYLHFESSNYYSSPPSEITYIKSHVGFNRVMTIGDLLGAMHAFRPELGSAFQVQEVTSLNEGVLPEYIHYFHKAVTMDGVNPIDPMFPTLLYLPDKPYANIINWDMINLLGVKYILMPSYFVNYKEFAQQKLSLVFQNSKIIIFENPHVIPRAFSIDLAVTNDTKNVTLPTNFYTGLSPVAISIYKNAFVQLKGYAKKSSVVVLSDNWSPNWQATVNGIVSPIIKVNGVFRGIAVNPGSYVIDMQYRPRTLTAALIISTSILGLLLLLLMGRKKIDGYLKRRWAVWA